MAKLPITHKARAAAKSMAVHYCAYQFACKEKDAEGIVCWGPLLIETAKLLGLEELIDVRNVENMVTYARHDIRQARRKADEELLNDFNYVGSRHHY